GSLRDARAVGVETQYYRRIHRVGDAVVSEQPWTAAAEAATAVVPDLVDTLNVGLECRGQGSAAGARAGVHRPQGTERAETGGGFRAYRTRHRACFGILWPALAGELGGILTDGERIPYAQLAMPQHRHAAARTVAIELLADARRIERDDALRE